MCSLNSNKQSQVDYLRNEINDDLGASAASLGISQSAMFRSSCPPITSFIEASVETPTKGSHQKDPENSMLFKTKAQPRCLRRKRFESDGNIKQVLQDKTNYAEP